MNPPLSTHALAMAAIAILVGWRIYRRVRRQIGRQEVRPRRLLMTAIFFPLLLVLVMLPSFASLRLLEAVVGGAIAGIVVGLIGLKLTRFEVSADGHAYVPNTLLGVAISLLFIGRLVYRFGAIYLAVGSVEPAGMQSFGRSPLTLALFAVVAGYYTTFSIGVLRWYRKAKADAPPVADAMQNPTA